MLGLENVFTAGSFQEFTGQIIGIVAVAGLFLLLKCIRPLQRARTFTESRRLYKRSSKSSFLRYLESRIARKAGEEKKNIKKEDKEIPKPLKELSSTEKGVLNVEEELAEIEVAVSVTSETAHVSMEKLVTEQKLFDDALNKIVANCAVYLNKTAEQQTREDVVNIDASVKEMFHTVKEKTNEWNSELETQKLGLKALHDTISLVRTDFHACIRHENRVKRASNTYCRKLKRQIWNLKRAKADIRGAEANLAEITALTSKWDNIEIPQDTNLVRFARSETKNLIHRLKLHRPTSSYRTLNSTHERFNDINQTLLQPIKVLKSQIQINEIIINHRKNYPVVLGVIEKIEKYMTDISEILDELKPKIGCHYGFNFDKQYEKILATEEYQTHQQLEEDKAKNEIIKQDMQKMEAIVQNLSRYFAVEKAEPAA